MSRLRTAIQRLILAFAMASSIALVLEPATLLSEDGQDGSTARQAAGSLHQLLGRYQVVTPNLSCGAQPTTRAHFEALARQDVAVIVSVDGARPNIDLAEQFGLEYVHIPLGYDGISRPSCLALSSVLEKYPGKVFVHCHHGKHRAPAAAAVAGIMSGQLTKQQAKRVLVEAETGQQYVGLWRDVAKAYPAHPAEETPVLVRVAEVEEIVLVMARVSRNYDFVTAQHPSTQDEQEEFLHRLLLLEEDFRELARNYQAADDSHSEMQPLFQRFGEDAAALRERASISNTVDPSWRKQLQDLKQDCNACHQSFRNGS